MTPAVSYAYVNRAEERPELTDQFRMCRDYAAARGYEIVSELNDIDEGDHPATGAAVSAVGDAITKYGAAVVLVYRPSDWALTRIDGLGAPIEDVAGPVERQRAV